MPFYVYGVARGGTALQDLPAGLFDQPTSWLATGPLAALVSICPGTAIRPERKHIAASQRILGIVAEIDCLPMAFGTVVASEAAILEFLEQFQDVLLAQLQRISGAIEMGLALRLDSDPIAYLVAHTPELQAARARAAQRQRPATYEERLRVGQLCDVALRRFRESVAAQILAAIGPCCVETAMLATRADNEIANVAMLVARNGEGRLEAAVHEAARQFDDVFVFEILGPTPPYNFVQFEPIEP